MSLTNERAIMSNTQKKEIKEVLSLIKQVNEELKKQGKTVMDIADNWEDLRADQKEFLKNELNLNKTAEENAKLLKKREENLRLFASQQEKINLLESDYENKRRSSHREELEFVNEYTKAQINGDAEAFTYYRDIIRQRQAEQEAADKIASDLRKGLIKDEAEAEVQYRKYVETERTRIENQEELKRLEDKKKNNEKLSKEEEKKRRELKGKLGQYGSSSVDISGLDFISAFNKQGIDIDDIGGSILSNIKNIGSSMVGGSGASGSGAGLGAGTGIAIGVAMSAINMINGFLDKMSGAIENSADLFKTYQGKITYRLGGLGRDFNDVYDAARNAIGLSGVASVPELIKRIGEAVDQGIAYNVEMRSFISAVSDDIQSTFDAFDSNLARIIRIQQADSTTARLGMEKALNDILTNMYKDSSYLNTVFDAVSQNLFEMTSTMPREASVSTEFIIQKWLGGLYSLGASEGAISAISQGLGYLGSGNVQALSGNTALQNLLAMSASRAGLDYASLLTGGLNPADTNELLKAMVDYLAEIAESTSANKVVTSAYGNVFGLSMSDIMSFKNLAQSANDLYGQNFDYRMAQNVAGSAYNKYILNIGSMKYLSNLMSNMELDYASTFTRLTGGIGYFIYKLFNELDSITGGGPTVNLEPWGIGASFKIGDLVKYGIASSGILGMLGSGIFSGISSLANGGPFSPKAWGYEDIVSGGRGFNLGDTSGKSYNSFIGSGSSSDITAQTLKEGSETSRTVGKESGMSQEHTFEDLFSALFNDGDKHQLSDVKLKIDSIDSNISKAMDIEQSLIDAGSKRALNVNLSQVNGITLDSNNGIYVRPDKNMEGILGDVASYIRDGTAPKLLSGMTIKTQGGDEITLQDLLNILVPMLNGDTIDGIPVRIESIDSINNLMSDLRAR